MGKERLQGTAINLFGFKIKASDSFVRNDWEPLVKGIANTDWHYYAQDNWQQAYKDMQRLAATGKKKMVGCKELDEYNRLVVLGYSGGGDAAVTLLNRLKGYDGVQVDLVFTVDPVHLIRLRGAPVLAFGSFPKVGQNTFTYGKPFATWLSYYQQTDKNTLAILFQNRHGVRGQEIPGATNTKYDAVNLTLTIKGQRMDLSADGHIIMPQHPDILAAMRKKITEVAMTPTTWDKNRKDANDPILNQKP
jgi:hypothetical protein